MKSGNVFYQGRSDSIIKLKGICINLMEIQNFIKKTCQNSVSDVHVLSIEIPPLAKRIVAYSICQEKDACEIQLRCKQYLPIYMVPEIICMEKYPLQPQTGKVNRQALKQMYITRWKNTCEENNISKSQSTTSNSILEAVVTIISEELMIDKSKCDLGSSFFSLGGKSLDAVRTVLKLNERGFNISMEAFIASSSISDVIDILEHADDKHLSNSSRIEEKYEIVPFCKSDHQSEAIEILAKSFVEKTLLDQLVGTTVDQWKTMLQKYWDSMCDDHLTVVAIDKTVGNHVVGIAMQMGLQHDMTKMKLEPSSGARWEFRYHVLEPVMRDLLQNGDAWMYSGSLAVDSEMPSETSIGVAVMMNKHCQILARERGYTGIVSIEGNMVAKVCISKK